MTPSYSGTITSAVWHSEFVAERLTDDPAEPSTFGVTDAGADAGSDGHSLLVYADDGGPDEHPDGHAVRRESPASRNVFQSRPR